MADDGYALAGLRNKKVDPATSVVDMEKQLAAYPNGDMAAEGAWRLAWNTHLAGDTLEAIAIADKMIQTLSLEGDPVHVLALTYWSARWRIYPTLKADKLNPDKEMVEAGIDRLMALINRHPTRFYALLAAQRLYELDPDLLSKAKRPEWPNPRKGWRISAEEKESAEFKRSVMLAQLGLTRDAAVAFQSISKRSPTHMSIYAFLSQQSDPILAHNVLHKQLNQIPPAAYEDNHRQILSHAYPDKYLGLVNHKITVMIPEYLVFGP